MLIDFNQMVERRGPGMNGGTGELSAKMYMDSQGKMILCRVHPGGSIGLHQHTASDDINYILSGMGTAICDGREEALTQGVCHVCKKGSEHSIMNTGSDDLIILTIVVER